MYILSDKTKTSIQRCLFEIVEGRFAERTIKELLIDLREFAKQIPSDSDPKFEKFDQAVRHFVEICDFVAHPNRDHRSIIENNIRTQSEMIADALANNRKEIWSYVTTIRHVMYCDPIVAALLAVASKYLSYFDNELDRDVLLRSVFERKHEIALCIISILQGSFIELRNNKGRAVLHIVSYEGHYRLYCRLLGSRVEQDARARTGRLGKIMIDFPVLVTTAPDIDGVLPQVTQEISPLPNDTQSLPLVETYRGTDERLHVRLIGNVG